MHEISGKHIHKAAVCACAPVPGSLAGDRDRRATATTTLRLMSIADSSGSAPPRSARNGNDAAEACRNLNELTEYGYLDELAARHAHLKYLPRFLAFDLSSLLLSRWAAQRAAGTAAAVGAAAAQPRSSTASRFCPSSVGRSHTRSATSWVVRSTPAARWPPVGATATCSGFRSCRASRTSRTSSSIGSARRSSPRSSVPTPRGRSRG